jgi:hypothetical protein
VGEPKPIYRSPWRGRFFDYDPYSQALAKIERGHQQDLADARALIAAGMVDPSQLRAFFVQIRERLLTETAYVALDADAFDEKVQSFLATLEPFGAV